VVVYIGIEHDYEQIDQAARDPYLDYVNELALKYVNNIANFQGT